MVGASDVRTSDGVGLILEFGIWDLEFIWDLGFWDLGFFKKMDFTTVIIIWLCAVALAAGFTQGLAGFGFAVICTPLLSLVVSVKTSIPVSALCGGAATLPMIVILWRHILWRPVLVLAVSTVPGIWLGAKLLREVPAAWIVVAMGVTLAAVGVFQLCDGRVPKAWQGRALCATCGFLSGALGAVSAAPGPPLIVYTSLQPWDVREAKAVLSVFFLLQSLVIVPVFGMNGLLTREVGLVCAWVAPFVAVGMAGGMWLSHLLRERTLLMRRIIYGAVLLLGVSMLAKAFWS